MPYSIVELRVKEGNQGFFQNRIWDTPFHAEFTDEESKHIYLHLP